MIRWASSASRYCLPVNITTAIVCVAVLCLDGCAGHASYKPDRELATGGQKGTASYQKSNRETARYRESGGASYYAERFHNRKTASGERLNNRAMTAAHRTLPFGTEVIVKNLDNGKSVKVRINDRGPFVKGRIIDLTTQVSEFKISKLISITD